MAWLMNSGIVSLEALGRTTKLSLGVGNNVDKMTIYVRFLTQWKRPNRTTIAYSNGFRKRRMAGKQYTI